MNRLDRDDSRKYSGTRRYFDYRGASRADRRCDRVIDGRLSAGGSVSELIDPNHIDELLADLSSRMKYPDALKYTDDRIKKMNKMGGCEIRKHRVDNPDNDSGLFESVNGPVPKFTYQLGNSTKPEFNILFITGTHGEESRLWRAGLDALLQLAGSGDARAQLLSRGQVTFDIFGDIHGFDNQSRGFVDRSGRQINEPLVTGRKHDRNPFGLGDRNGEQGRNSAEAISLLTRANHLHYAKHCGRLSWIGDHHETNENSNYPSWFFRYGGIMLMAHVYFTDEELHMLNSLKRALTATDKVRMFLNTWTPFSGPRYREQLLYNHPSLKTLKMIRDRVRALGQRTFEDVNEKALLMFPRVERDFSIDESIWIGGEMFRIPGILLGPDVLAPQGLTSESFQQDLTVRMRQTLAVMEAQLTVIGGGHEH